MTSSMNQSAIGGDVLGVAAVAAFQGSGYSESVERIPRRSRIRHQLTTWLHGRHEARSVSVAKHEEHVEAHWQTMAADYDESWRWRANSF